MDRSTPIYLVAETYTEDAYGVMTPATAERLVYANVRNVSQSEFFDGGRAGLNPEFKMTMFAFDYQGEKVVKYNGLYFEVYRTYLAGTDTLELYVQRKQGTRNMPAPTPAPTPDDGGDSV